MGRERKGPQSPWCRKKEREIKKHTLGYREEEKKAEILRCRKKEKEERPSGFLFLLLCFWSPTLLRVLFLLVFLSYTCWYWTAAKTKKRGEKGQSDKGVLGRPGVLMSGSARLDSQRRRKEARVCCTKRRLSRARACPCMSQNRQSASARRVFSSTWFHKKEKNRKTHIRLPGRRKKSGNRRKVNGKKKEIFFVDCRAVRNRLLGRQGDRRHAAT